MPLVVEKINEGTVIDHIAAGAGSRVLQILSAQYPISGTAALIINAHSKRLGKKDIVKMEGVFVDEKTANRISIIAPDATMNIIKGGKVADKHKVVVPSTLCGILRCPNPKCITNIELAETVFSPEGGKLRCRHCERSFHPGEFA
jgi:aspartate carbamoyltransferase regulatory subunit